MCCAVTKAEKHGCELKSAICHFTFLFSIFHQGSVCLCLELTMQRKQKTLLASSSQNIVTEIYGKCLHTFTDNIPANMNPYSLGHDPGSYVGCFMCVSTALCVLNPQQEKALRPFKSHLIRFGANTQYRDEMGGTLRYCWHTSEASTPSAGGL